MNTTETRAQAYACKIWASGRRFAFAQKLSVQGYITGAQEERAQLTKWNDPKKPPISEKEVLLKLDYEDDGAPGYAVAQWLSGIQKWRMDDSLYGYKIIGWREIFDQE